MGTKTKASKTSADWSLAPRGVVSTTVQAGMALVAVSSVGQVAHIHPVWGATAGAVGALGHTASAAHHDHGPAPILYRLGCWTGAGGWLTWAWATGSTWHPSSLAALAIGAIGAGVLAPITRPKPSKRSGAKPAGTEVVPANRPGGQVGAEWERRFLRVTRVPVQVIGVETWDNDGGFTLTCALPEGGATREGLARYSAALAADARLPEGCGVEFLRGGHRGVFKAAVTTVNRLGSADGDPVKLHYPASYTPQSILDGIGLGEHRDGSVARIPMREESMLLIAPKGGGKTNVLDIANLEIGRCTDAMAWHIDLNGGGMSQLWLAPWLAGDMDEPAIDWAASTPEEALMMAVVMLEIARDRKTSARHLKQAHNTKLLPVSADMPEIVPMVDEGAEALSPSNNDPIVKQLRAALEEVQRIARNEAVNPMISSLRPTQDHLPIGLFKQARTRIALFGTDEGDLGHMFGWRSGISPDDLPSKGTGFVRLDGGLPRAFKAWYLEPAQIADAARAIAGIRPRLDPRAVEIANAEYEIDFGDGPVRLANIYAGRHERMRQAFNGEEVTLPYVDGQPTRRTKTAPASSTRSASGGQDGTPRLRVVKGSAAASWPEPFAQPTAAQTGGTRASDWPEPKFGSARTALPVKTAARAELPAGDPATTPTPTATVDRDAVPEILRRAEAAFAAAEDDRMHSEVLATALGAGDVWKLAELMRSVGVTPAPSKFMRNGATKRGYLLADIRTAIGEHARAASS